MSRRSSLLCLVTARIQKFKLSSNVNAVVLSLGSTEPFQGFDRGPLSYNIQVFGYIVLYN